MVIDLFLLYIEIFFHYCFFKFYEQHHEKIFKLFLYVNLPYYIMEFSYDKKANALYLRFSLDKVTLTDEISDGVIVDYNERNKIIGIEILNFTKRSFDLNSLILMNADEIIPTVLECQ
ncbi:MAG: DUF2283 domain-containing protein [Candidatus Helarchaeota archaeon]